MKTTSNNLSGDLACNHPKQKSNVLQTSGWFLSASIYLFAVTSGFGQTISWDGGGDGVSWSDPLNWSGDQLPGAANDVVINAASGQVVHSAGNTTVRSIQCAVGFFLSGGGFSVTAGASELAGAFTISGSLAVYGAGASLSATGPTTNVFGRFIALGGGALRLPTLTSLTVSNDQLWDVHGAGSLLEFPALTNLHIAAGPFLQLSVTTGARLDLSRVRQFSGTVSIDSYDTGSVVDLSGLTDRWSAEPGSSSIMTADRGGSILMPNVIELDQMRVKALNGGTIQTDNLRKLTRVDLTVHSSILRMTNVTSLTVSNPGVNSSWSISGAGGLVDFSRLTNLVVGNGNLLAAQVSGGARLDLSGLVQSAGALQLYAHGAGSVLDVSSLAGHWRGGTGQYRLQAVALNNGNILIPQITSMDRGNMVLINGGTITTAQMGELYDVSLTVNNASLNLSNVTSLILSNNVGWQINGASSSINFSGLTNVTILPSGALDLRVENGAYLNLSGVRHLNGTVYIYTFNPGSVVDLSGLTGRWGDDAGSSPQIFLEAQGGSAILFPNVTELYRAQLSARGGSTIQMNALRKLHSVDLTADNSILRLTNVTTLVVSNSSPVWVALGASALVDFSRLTDIVVVQGSVLHVRAYTGGRVDLSRLDNLFSGAVQVTASGAGSVVDLSSLSGFVNRFNTPAAFLTAETGGNILLSDDAFLLANVRVNISDHPVLPPISTPSAALTLYGRAWHSYRIESRLLNDGNAPWTLYRRVPLTNSFLVLAAVTPTNQAFRVEEFVADPPIVELHRAPGQMVQLTLFGGTNKTYQIVSAPGVPHALPWEAGDTVAMTNSFRIFPPAPAADSARFFRAREL